MKKAVGISLFIFWTFVVAIVASGLTMRYSGKSTGSQQTPAQDAANNLPAGTKLDLALVSKHASKDDCWMIVGNKVYDVTGSISKHPGGAALIIKYCGKDGTQAFATKDIGPGEDHSSRAYDMLKEYYIGDVGQVFGGTSASPATSTKPAVSEQAPSQPVVAPTGVTLNMAEISKHNTAKDCWMVIGGNVYSLAGSISAHPGGADTIIRYCGKDGTAGFATKDKTPGRDHSGNAYDMLKPYYIGKLNQVLSSTPKPSSTSPAQPSVPATPPAPMSAGNITLTAAEVAKHTTAADCWMIIGGKVYSLSSYLSAHPGGASIIVRYCGQDGTTAFATKGSPGGSNHSSGASADLANYLIGTVGQTLPASQINASINQSASTPPASGESEEEDDD